MVHFPGLAHTRLCIQRAVSECCSEGFPHSEIPGSMPACGSPGLIAACHVLDRLPKHHLDKHRLSHSSTCTTLGSCNICGYAMHRRFVPSEENTKKASALRNAYLFSCQRSVPQVRLSFPLPVEKSRQNYGRKIKNPASSAGLNRHILAALRVARQIAIRYS